MPNKPLTRIAVCFWTPERAKHREAPVRFGSVTVWRWNGSSGSGFRFRRFLCKKGFSVGISAQFNRKGRFRFRFLENGSGGSGSAFGFGKKRFRRFRFPVPVRFLSHPGNTKTWTWDVAVTSSCPLQPCWCRPWRSAGHVVGGHSLHIGAGKKKKPNFLWPTNGPFGTPFFHKLRNHPNPKAGVGVQR